MRTVQPRRHDRVGQCGAHDRCRVDFQVVRPEGVDAVDRDVGPSLANPPVAALALTAVDLIEIAMDADQVHIQARQ